MPADARTRVMLVDSRRLFRDGLRLMIGDEGRFEVVAEAETGEEAERYARGHRPDIAIVGPFMVNSGGHGHSEIVEAIRTGSPETRILLMTSNADSSRSLAEGLDAGATGVIEMNATIAELQAAVARLADGEPHVPPSIALEMLRSSRADDAGLTERDERLLGEIALGYTNAEIAQHMHLSVRTVESHRSRIQQKLGATSRADLVREALDRQLVH